MVSVDLTDEQLQQHVLTYLSKNTEIKDSAEMVADLKISAKVMDGALKSLNVDEYVDLKVIDLRLIELTKEGASYLESGTPEFQYASAMEVNVEIPKGDMDKKVGAQIAKIGFQKAMQNKWVKLCGEKKAFVMRIAETIADNDKVQLEAFKSKPNFNDYDPKLVDAFKKRKLIT
jgi:hypothetical protein